jgi:hypothetical protein
MSCQALPAVVFYLSVSARIASSVARIVGLSMTRSVIVPHSYSRQRAHPLPAKWASARSSGTRVCVCRQAALNEHCMLGDELQHPVDDGRVAA